MGPDGRRNLMGLLQLGFSGKLLERLGDLRWVRRADRGRRQMCRVRRTRHREDTQQRRRKSHPSLLSMTYFGWPAHLDTLTRWRCCSLDAQAIRTPAADRGAQETSPPSEPFLILRAVH